MLGALGIVQQLLCLTYNTINISYFLSLFRLLKTTQFSRTSWKLNIDLVIYFAIVLKQLNANKSTIEEYTTEVLLILAFIFTAQSSRMSLQWRKNSISLRTLKWLGTKMSNQKHHSSQSLVLSNEWNIYKHFLKPYLFRIMPGYISELWQFSCVLYLHTFSF